ncbi:MAG: VapC toxin family PIN domain ribonuclease [Candidatus Riflebacteria bacterium HGW-Riflebacteria-1]|jgi:tRNA(fMet)-specific endonuclease VapC|nr:MAG: VapC toxin family PIN domain ribonuclease [Candidatus Riflebacteria bacterium HGW-Riflebacteria-1]
MRRISIDTNIYSAFKLDDPAVKTLFRNTDYIGIDITVIAELFAGFRNGSREQINRDELKLFLNNPRTEILQHDLETAEFYSFILCRLRTLGKPIPTNDIWIAANSMRHGLSLCSKDRHFESIEGLLLIKA